MISQSHRDNQQSHHKIAGIASVSNTPKPQLGKRLSRQDEEKQEEASISKRVKQVRNIHSLIKTTIGSKHCLLYLCQSNPHHLRLRQWTTDRLMLCRMRKVSGSRAKECKKTSTSKTQIILNFNCITKNQKIKFKSLKYQQELKSKDRQEVAACLAAS